MASDWDVTNKRLRSNYGGRVCQERRWATWEKTPSIIPKRHWRGSRVGREWVPQSYRKKQCRHFCWILSLEKVKKKMFETHCTITYPEALPLDFRVMRSAAVQEISWVRIDWGQTAQLALPSYLFKDRFLKLIKSHKIKRIFQDSSWWPQQEAGFAKGRSKSCWVLPSFQNYVLWIEERRWKLNIDFFKKIQSTQWLGGSWSCKDLTSTIWEALFASQKWEHFAFS